MHRPISDQAGGNKGGKGPGGQFGRMARGFAAPVGGFPRQDQAKPADAAAEGEASPTPVKRRSVKERKPKRGFTLLELLIVIGIIVIVASLVLAVSSSVVRASEERATRNTLEVLTMAAEEYERTVDRRVNYQSGAVAGGIVTDPIPTAANGLRFDVSSASPLPPANTGVAAWTTLASPYGTITGGLPAYSLLPFRRTVSFIGIMSESPACAAILQKLPDAIFRGVKPAANTNSFTAVRHCIDAWDTPIVAIFPGRDARLVADATGAADNPNFIDKDGTVRCDSEWGSANAQGGLQVSCRDRKILFVSAGNDARFTVQAGTVYTPSNDNLYSYQP